MRAAALLLVLADGFDVQSVAVPGKVVSHATADLDGDGANDLLLATVPEEGGEERRLLVFRGRPDGAFASAPDLAIPVKRDVLAWGAGPIGVQGEQQILFLTRGGAFAFDARTEEYRENVRRIATFASLFEAPDLEDLPRWPHLSDCDGDGIAELLVPERGRARVFGRNPAQPEGAWVERGVIPVGRAPASEQWARRRSRAREVRISIGAVEIDPGSSYLRWKREDEDLLSVSARLPIPAFADSDGDGRLDLFLLEGRVVRVHREGETRSFPVEPTWSGTIPGTEDWPSQVRLGDFDGDGRADLLALGAEEGKALSGVQLVELFAGEEGGIRFEPPAGLWKVEGLGLWIEPVDVDGDGGQDLVFVSVDVPDTLEMLRKGASVEWHFLVFRGRSGEGLERAPSLRFTESYSAAETFSGDMIATLGGDLDGDGVCDLARAGPDDRLSIHRIVSDSRGRLGREERPIFTSQVERTPFDLALSDLGSPARTALLVLSRGGFTVVRRK